MIPVYLQECATPHGPVQAAATDLGLCRITVPGETFADLMRWLDRRLPDADVQPAAGKLDYLAAALEDFFAGAPLPPLPVDLRGTPFQRRVWEAVLLIPHGETRSYADIARAIGHPHAGRAVGAANAVNPLPFIVPCHRVVGADGSIKGFPGGIVNRRMLLELEGVSPRARA